MSSIVEFSDGVEAETCFFSVGLHVGEGLVVSHECTEFVVSLCVGLVAEVCRTLDNGCCVFLYGILGVEYLDNEVATTDVELLEFALLHTKEGVEVEGIVACD